MSRFIYKDGKRYLFASKKTNIDSIFGITPEIKKEVDERLESQRNFLKDTFIEINEEKYISLYDMSISSNIKPDKYYGEIFNRVSTIRKYAKEIGFTADVFMTLTPPSYLKPLKQVKLKRDRIKMVDNPRFNGEFDYVNKAREYQSEKWTKFLSQRIFKDIKKKYGERLIFMRTYEPMIDGTPHVHIVALIPPEFKERFVKLAKKYFSETRFDIKTDFDDGIGGVVAYILKYILKSFSNSKTHKLDDVGYWYAYHQIRKFSTSRTLIPLRIYRLMNSKDEYKNLLNTTKLYKMGDIQVEVQYDSWKYHDKDFIKLESTDYKVSEISVLVDDGIETSFHIVYKKSDNISMYKIDRNNPTKKPKKFVIHKPIEDVKKPIPVHIEGVSSKFLLDNGKLLKMVIVPSKMKSLDLYQYYLKISRNIDTTDLVHFGITQNECIKRGLIDDIKIEPLNNFNTEIQNKELSPCGFDLSVKKALFSYSVKNTQFKESNRVIADLHTGAFYKAFHRFDRYKRGA